MAVQLTILPVSINPQKDELFSSWLFRLASKNFTKAHTFCRFHLPGYAIWNRDIDKLASDNLITRLSLITSIPYEHIYKTTLRSYEGSLFEHCNAFGNQKWVLPLKIFHRERRGYGLQFCPKCLADDSEPYFRKSWRLALSVSCTKCSLLLHDKCPFCEKPITFFRNELGVKASINSLPLFTCYSCKSDLRNSPRYPTRIGTIGFQKKIFKYLSDGHCRNLPYSISYFEVLYQVIKLLTTKQKKISAFKSLVFDYENMNQEDYILQKGFERTATINREKILTTAVWLLEDWPNRFVNLCQEAKTSASYVLKDFINPPFWFSSVVITNVHQPTAIELNYDK